MAKKKIELTDEQEKLAAELTKLQLQTVINIECHGMSGVKAYQAAGGKSKGRNAEVNSSKLLSLDKVKAFRKSFAVEIVKDSIMSREEALERLSLHARIKITDICTFQYVEFTDEDGNEYVNTIWSMKNAEDIDPDIAACIKSVTFTKSGPKIELYDANGSIKLLSDMQGWNAPKKLDHSSTDGTMSPNELSDEQLDARIAEALKKDD